MTEVLCSDTFLAQTIWYLKLSGTVVVPGHAWVCCNTPKMQPSASIAKHLYFYEQIVEKILFAPIHLCPGWQLVGVQMCIVPMDGVSLSQNHSEQVLLYSLPPDQPSMRRDSGLLEQFNLLFLYFSQSAWCNLTQPFLLPSSSHILIHFRVQPMTQERREK